MTNERAIELLHRLQDEQFDGIHGDERREALEMAVRALEQNLVKESGDLVQDLVEDSSSDLISRKAVMKEFSDFVRESNNSDFAPTPTWNDAVSLVGSMPSAQPQRKKGRWNTIQGDIVVCSVCGMSAPKVITGCLMNRHLEPNRTDYCPNCGARMEQMEDDNV